MFIFRQLFDAKSSTYTYLLADSGQALLIDPVFGQAQRDMALLRELGLRLVATLDTHVHADHVTAAWLLQQRLGSAIVLSQAAGADGASRLLLHGDHVAFGNRWVEARATPGHTSGCMSYVLDDHNMAFSGDALLVRGCGRTDFQQGSAARLHASVHEQLFSLPPTCLVYPAHDYRGFTVSSVAEERRFNPRLGGDASVGDFSVFMDHLGLPHPGLIDVAVPANLRCGRPLDCSNCNNGSNDDKGSLLPPHDPRWAQLTFSFAGIWEITSDALAEHDQPLQTVDVREPAEWTDALGHIRGALLLPMGQLATRQHELDKTLPVVTVCRSGTRSAQAAVLLARAGFDQVANLAGGMLAWRAAGHPVDGEGGL